MSRMTLYRAEKQCGGKGGGTLGERLEVGLRVGFGLERMELGAASSDDTEQAEPEAEARRGGEFAACLTVRLVRCRVRFLLRMH